MNFLKYVLPFVFAGNVFSSDLTVESVADSSNKLHVKRKEVKYKDKRVDLSYGNPSNEALDNLVKENEEVVNHDFGIVKKDSEKLVVVPNVSYFVFEISKWSKDKKWPVFIEGNKYLDKFIDAYNPCSVVKAGNVCGSFEVNEDNVYQALIASQGRDGMSSCSDSDKVKYFEMCDKKGIVLTKLDDGCFPGAFALAAYHGQWLDFMGNFLVKHDAGIGEFVAKKLQKRVLDKVKEFDYKGMGNLDYLTIGLDFAYKYKGKWEFGDANYCLDDLLGRDKNGEQWAYHGRLIDCFDGDFFGGAALFQAMSALFLDNKKCLMFDTYWSGWDGYKADLAYAKLKDVLDVTLVQRPESSEKMWKQLMGKKNIYDLIFVQSRGTPDGFNTGKDEKGSYSLIPSKSVPCAVLFTHSYSAANPYDPNTIAGRFLKSGAYVYHGSISEPFVDSYNQPGFVANKLLLGKSLGEATQDRRLAEGNCYHDSKKDGTKPWRNIFIGDPRKVWNVKRERK